MITSFEYDKGYKKAVFDIIEALEKAPNTFLKDYVKSRKNIVQFLKLYQQKADKAIKCPDVTKFKVNDKKQLIEIYFRGEE